jgi:hypothetical protein
MSSRGVFSVCPVIASAAKQSRRYVRLPRRFAPRNDHSGITPQLLSKIMFMNNGYYPKESKNEY